MVTTLVNNVLTLADWAVVVGCGGAGAGAPLIGTSPARTVTDNNPVRAIASTKRFMFWSLLCDWGCKLTCIKNRKADIDVVAVLLAELRL